MFSTDAAPMNGCSHASLKRTSARSIRDPDVRAAANRRGKRPWSARVPALRNPQTPRQRSAPARHEHHPRRQPHPAEQPSPAHRKTQTRRSEKARRSTERSVGFDLNPRSLPFFKKQCAGIRLWAPETRRSPPFSLSKHQGTEPSPCSPHIGSFAVRSAQCL